MKKKKNKNTVPEQPLTAEEQHFEELREKRRQKLVKFRKRLKWYHILMALIVLALIALFVGWHLKPKREMNVVTIDKTVLSYSEDEDINKDHIYRKHQGFTRILNQQRYVKEDGTDYDYKQDYFGPVVDEEGAYSHETDLGDATGTPDLVYMCDGYGMGNDTFGHYNGSTPLNAGISSNEMSYISFAHEYGAQVITEMALFSSPMSDSVHAQMTALTGVTPTKWIGRYIVDLEDFSDVPDWAPPMYEQQEGVEWRFTGPGILLVSNDGKIIILEQNTDFSSQNLLEIYINDEYKDEFGGCDKCNFYNWFELVQPNYGTETIATFAFDLNAVGMEKIKELSKIPRFAAVTRRQEEGYAPVYYFAGDCCDYVNGDRYGCFLFANEFFKFLSYDRQGDISNFYWRFYTPLLRHILDNTASRMHEEAQKTHAEVSRVNNGSFQVLEDDKWKSLRLKAVSLNAQKPGEKQYSRDFTYYEALLSSAGDMGVNCITAKTLLPPEFYAALSRYNKQSPETPMYLLQHIVPPEGLEPAGYLSEDGLEKWRTEIESVIKALHGEMSVEGAKTGRANYFIDISAFLLGVTVDPVYDGVGSLASYHYEGDYTAAKSGAEGLAAMLYNAAQRVSKETYGYYTPIAVSTPLSLTKGLWFTDDDDAFVQEDMVKPDCAPYFYNDILLDNALIERTAAPANRTVYDRCLAVFRAIGENVPSALTSGLGVSAVNAVYGQPAVTEKEQGDRLVEALRAAKDAELLGTVIYDLNDSWDGVSEDMSRFTAAPEDSYLWHNTCDVTQTTGIIAVDSVQPETPGLVLTDDDLVQSLSLSDDAGYLYLTIQLLQEIDYKASAMFVGLDTFQRNDGEYFYAKDFTGNSLSGMEFSLRFDEKQKAALYVINSYDRSHGTAITKESYTAAYQKVADLVYGSFSTGDSQFYQTGSTIYVRLPWTWLNVADPSKKLVLNDPQITAERAKTAGTNGVLASVMIGDRKSRDVLYAFPQDKHALGYKVFQWSKWETAEYALRRRDSFGILKQYFAQ